MCPTFPNACGLLSVYISGQSRLIIADPRWVFLHHTYVYIFVVKEIIHDLKALLLIVLLLVFGGLHSTSNTQA